MPSGYVSNCHFLVRSISHSHQFPCLSLTQLGIHREPKAKWLEAVGRLFRRNLAPLQMGFRILRRFFGIVSGIHLTLLRNFPANFRRLSRFPVRRRWPKAQYFPIISIHFRVMVSNGLKTRTALWLSLNTSGAIK